MEKSISNKIKCLGFIWFMLMQTCLLFAQTDPATDGPLRKKTVESGFTDRLFTGGNLSFQAGNITLIDVSPLIGYKITDKIAVGIGGTYMYYGNSYYKYKTNIYGGRVFGRYYILENLFAHAEYEILNLEVYNSLIRDFSRKNVESLLVGLGYRASIGGKSYVNLMALWNFNDTPDSPYNNPIIRVGVDFGL